MSNILRPCASALALLLSFASCGAARHFLDDEQMRAFEAAGPVTPELDRDALLAVTLADGRTVEAATTEMAGVIGEKIELGRVAVLPGDVAVYLHHRASDLPPQVGVIVAYSGDEAAAKGAAMQVAAMRPQYLVREDVPADIVENERRIAEATAKEEGKPEAALPKIVEGRVNAFFKDNVLLEQPSVVDNKKTVAQVLQEAGTTVTGFARFEPGQA